MAPFPFQALTCTKYPSMATMASRPFLISLTLCKVGDTPSSNNFRNLHLSQHEPPNTLQFIHAMHNKLANIHKWPTHLVHKAISVSREVEGVEWAAPRVILVAGQVHTYRLKAADANIPGAPGEGGWEC